MENIDGVVLSAFSNGPYCHPYDSLEFTDKVEEISGNHSKPIAMNFVADLDTIERTKREKAYPIFNTVEDAVSALSTQWAYRKARNRSHSPYLSLQAQKEIASEILTNRQTDHKAMAIADIYGIRCEMPVTAVDLADALSKADILGYPLVMKIKSPDISHKTDAGGVITDINSNAELEKAYDEIMDNMKNRPEFRIHGIILQKMIPDGIELIIGGKFDNDFGPVIMFGMGGIFVEIFDDVAFRMAPICREEAYEMIEQSRGYALLKGARGETPYDISALADALERFSVLLADFPEILELELNPVKLLKEGEGLVAVDGRIEIGLRY